MGKKQPKYEDFADAAAWEADEEEYESGRVTDQETRRDTDGNYYTKDEFIEFYGGSRRRAVQNRNQTQNPCPSPARVLCTKSFGPVHSRPLPTGSDSQY